MPAPATRPRAFDALLGRFDPAILPPPRRPARVRLQATEDGELDVILTPGGEVRGEPTDGAAQPGATLTADLATWERLSGDLAAALGAFRDGRLRVRGNLHLGIGLLAATAGSRRPGALRFLQVRTPGGWASAMEAGIGEPVVLVHGLGATKGSFLPTVAALAGSFRAIALDLPGFGDSAKPIGAPYDAPFFARAVLDLLDALELDRAHLVGNSMGGRVAIEAGLLAPERVGALGLLAPSLAWLRARPWAAPLRLLRPELGLLQPAPRALVDGLVRRLVPESRDGWGALGVDEFLRAYGTRRGRAAFYAAARNIYLEDPHGPEGFWTRLGALRPPALFVWGRDDPLVPRGFARHVERCLPAARHLELSCGHVPQLERPRETHAALTAFLRETPLR